MEALILTEVRNQIAILTINRPQQLNALNKDTIAALHTALGAADTDPNVGVIILTGSGEKAFVAGADIKEFADFSIAEGGALAQTGQQTLFDFIEQLGTPVIAAVNGFALGGGLELAMAAHIRIASSNAKMGLPETSLGVYQVTAAPNAWRNSSDAAKPTNLFLRLACSKQKRPFNGDWSMQLLNNPTS